MILWYSRGGHRKKTHQENHMQNTQQKFVITLTTHETFLSRLSTQLRKYLGVLGLFFMISTIAVAAELNQAPETLVPGGKILKTQKNEKEIQTPKGSIVEVEFSSSGVFEEASGDALTAGDVLVPGGDLLTLQAAQEAVVKAGKSPQGDWSLEKSFLHGWVYEFEGVEKGQKMDYFVDAHSGKILKEKKDD
jgi:uncharacterized membrane protein YkoI